MEEKEIKCETPRMSRPCMRHCETFFTDYQDLKSRGVENPTRHVFFYPSHLRKRSQTVARFNRAFYELFDIFHWLLKWWKIFLEQDIFWCETEIWQLNPALVLRLGQRKKGSGDIGIKEQSTEYGTWRSSVLDTLLTKYSWTFKNFRKFQRKYIALVLLLNRPQNESKHLWNLSPVIARSVNTVLHIWKKCLPECESTLAECKAK